MAEVRKIGNFELLERIGQGGMGTVFKARQISMDRIVAVKILPPSLAKQRTFIERFVREARASARLSHPHVVNGIDVGEENGLYYFAMEYVDGASVKEVLAKRKFSEEQTIKIGRAMAAALAHAHGHGILHRDIKPDNILLDRNGTAKLCDLGLARLDSESEAEKNLTQQGQAVGTPHYISPEQARGVRNLTSATDLYSLGASLYHMLTGKTMFEGATSVLVMTKHVTDKAPPPSEHGVQVSKGLIAIVAKLLAKDPSDRYLSAELLVEDFDRLAKGKPPKNADLPQAKWPFAAATATPVPAAPPAKKVGVSTAAIADKARVTRRDTRGVSKVRGGAVLPLGMAAAALLAVGVGYLAFSGGRSSTSKESDRPGKAPSPSAVAVQQPVAQPKPQPKGPPPPRVAPTTDVVGFSRPAERTVRVAPKAETVGFAVPSAAPTSTPAVTAPEPKKAAAEATAETKTQPGPEAKTTDPAAVAKPEEDPFKVAPGPEVAALIAKALPLAAESKFREAAELFKLSDAKLKRLDSFDREMVRIHALGLAGLADIKPTIGDYLKRDPKKHDARAILPKAPGGTLAGADEKNLYIKGPGVDLPYKWEKLSLDDLNSLAALVLTTPPTPFSLGVGIVAFDQNNDKDDAFARKAMEKVNDPGAKKLLDLIEARDKLTIAKKQAVSDAYAEKLLFEMNDAMQTGKYATVPIKAAALRGKYGDTETAKERAAEIDELIEMAKLCASGNAVVRPGNVALALNGATATGSPTAGLLLDGIKTGYTGSTGFASSTWPDGELTVTFPKTYLLRHIRFLLWDGSDERFYRYILEVSHDGQTFKPLADRSQGQWRSWQALDFAPRPVKAIRIKCLYNSDNKGFYVVELEAYCTPPPPVPPQQPPFMPRQPRP
jgi:serine/threonine-protein kinase